MNADRRRFLKLLSAYFANLAAAEGVFARLVGSEQETTDEGHPSGESTPEARSFLDKYDPEDHLYVYVVDTNKCIGCGFCVKADRKENDVPEDHYRTWVERYQIQNSGEVLVDSNAGGEEGFTQPVTEFSSAKSFFVPKLCNHCDATPCIQVCPVGASYGTPDGLVMVDKQTCIGCGYCVQACPYGSRFINPKTHCADKCTLCHHRLVRGLKPACVLACPVGARQLGDLKNPGDPVRSLLSHERVMVLQPELRTKPNCYYLGLNEGVR